MLYIIAAIVTVFTCLLSFLFVVYFDYYVQEQERRRQERRHKEQLILAQIHRILRERQRNKKLWN